METRELRYFVTLAEELHFARAAARVGIEQSPLSKAIRKLERHLGVQLFIRGQRSTVLTGAGAIFLQDARRILAELDDARRKVAAAASGRSGCLRIAVSDGLSHPRIARLLAQSRTDNPDVEIQIIHRSFPEQLHGLRSGVIDIGFGLSASNDQELASLPLWHDPAVLVIRPDHRLSKYASVKELGADAGLFIVLGEPPPVGRTAGDAWLPSGGPIEYVASGELLLTRVAAGCGVGIISVAQAESIRRPDLTMRPLNVRDARVITYLLQRTRNTSSLVSRFTRQAQETSKEDIKLSRTIPLSRP